MSAINPETLADIPGLNPLEQFSPNSCGAFTITAALGAFELLPVTENREVAYQDEGPQEINVQVNLLPDMTFTQLATAVYRVTGILNPLTELIQNGNLNNSPAAMLQVALNVGVQNAQIFVQQDRLTQLLTFYPNAQNRCEAIIGDENIHVLEHVQYIHPLNQSINIVLVQHANGFHWVAQGSDQNFYDPGDGRCDHQWRPIFPDDRMGQYTFFGLWIELSHP